MTFRPILGLVLLNLFLGGVGAGVLFAVRGWRSWAELVRLSGLAYLLGVAAAGVAFVLELVVHVPLTLATILLTGVALAGGGGVAGAARGHRLPPLLAGPRLPRPGLVSGALAALTAVYLEALFRSGRLAGLLEFDAWAFWVPKAKAIYYFGGLDRQFFDQLPGPTYPPLVPALEAAAFRFMGSPDVVTLHLQFWFLLVGFLAALVGLLVTRVPPPLLWPPILLVLVTPHVLGHALQAQGDFLLDELFAVAGLLVALWLVERQAWQLVAAGILLAGMLLTKREGYLLAACIAAAAVLVSWRERRATWPWLAAVGAAAVALAIPWRVLLAVRHLGGGGPDAGGTGLFSHLDRAWPSLRLTLRTLFDYQVWLVVSPLAVLAVALAFLGGARRLSGYAALVFVLGVAGFTWVTWSFPSLPITEDAALNPIVRVTGSLVLLSAGLVPLLLAAAWRGRGARGDAP